MYNGCVARVLVAVAALAWGAVGCGQTERDPQVGFQVNPPVASSGGQAGAAQPAAGSGGQAGAAQPAAGAAQQGGSGGSSAAALGEAVAECQHYCEQLAYRLPQALCEDWHRQGWDPQFCGLSLPPDCPGYCAGLYAALTPECAATLPQVIACVAPTYRIQNVPKATDCWLGECRDLLFTMTSACYGLRDKLDAARARWDASGIGDYELRYDWLPDAPAVVEVRAGLEPSVTPADASAWTVPSLFAEVEKLLRQPGVAPNVAYDAELGYVTGLVRQQGCGADFGVVGGVTITPLP